MTIYLDGRSYIQEERRQIQMEIRHKQAEVARRQGISIAYDTAKRLFIENDLDGFMTAYRKAHQVCC